MKEAFIDRKFSAASLKTINGLQPGTQLRHIKRGLFKVFRNGKGLKLARVNA
jgi:hypothetical protein